MAMVVHANRMSSEYGGHIASYASSATLYEVGFNHFWRAPTAEHGGDLVYFQGHSSPGHLCARVSRRPARREQPAITSARKSRAGDGLSSYPHPWLMPDFWQFPTVSMGLGPMMAIYQARFMRYLEHRGIVPPQDRKVWCFLGDGEMDEPESLGAITMPVREKLDNLIFVINCNLQRLDGPVRGNGKIIQELEAAFRGAGWNVIKVVWGSRWDPLLARDQQGLAAQDDGRVRRRRVPELQGQGRRVHARALLRQVSRAQGDGREPVRRGHLAPEPRRPRSREGLCRVSRGRESQGPADGDPRQDRQGLRHGRGRRRPEHHAPAEEARRRRR